MTHRHVAVIDIGKTNAKLALVDLDSLTEVAVITRPNVVLSGPPWPHFDVEGHWDFLLDGLGRFHKKHGVDAISVTTHGASAALLDMNGGLAAPILDYEHTGPDKVFEEYAAIRPPFAETGSPHLAGGLNVGAQLYWQFKVDPGLKSRTHHIVTYPQYWGWRLTGVAATDVTSLGCHTDLWNPHKGRFSSLVESLEISERMAPVRAPSDVLGHVLPEISDRTGLPQGTPVHCGIHDSNASLVPYIVANEPPFSVVSTGTWVIAMSIGGKSVELDPELDSLIKVTALGDPAFSARFMGGREHDLATGCKYPQPTPEDLAIILSDQIMLMPALVPDTGPFKGQNSKWIGVAPKPGTGARGAAVALYLALVTAQCLSNIGHDGPILVEGPFAGNQLYLQMLSVATNSDVIASGGATGTSSGAAMLANGLAAVQHVRNTPVATPNEIARLLSVYAAKWRAQVTSP